MKRYIVHLNIPAYVIVEVQAEDEDEAIVQAEKFNWAKRITVELEDDPDVLFVKEVRNG